MEEEWLWAVTTSRLDFGIFGLSGPTWVARRAVSPLSECRAQQRSRLGGVQNDRPIVAGHPRADDVPRTFIEARATMHAVTACRADPEDPKAAKLVPLGLENHPLAF